MSDTGVLRWCAVAGVLTAAALAAAVVIPGIPPASYSSAGVVSAWILGHRASLGAAAILTPFTLFFGVFFLAGLFSLLRGPRENTILPLAVVLAGLATLLVPVVGAIAEGAIAYSAASLGSVALNRFAFDVLSISGVLAFVPAAAMTAAASFGGRAAAVFPTWLVWLGWVYVPVGLLGSVSAVSDHRGWFVASGAALFLLGAWILLVSVVMWRVATRAGETGRRPVGSSDLP